MGAGVGMSMGSACAVQFFWRVECVIVLDIKPIFFFIKDHSLGVKLFSAFSAGCAAARGCGGSVTHAGAAHGALLASP